MDSKLSGRLFPLRPDGFLLPSLAFFLSTFLWRSVFEEGECVNISAILTPMNWQSSDELAKLR